jgi:hypothetical protein
MNFAWRLSTESSLLPHLLLLFFFLSLDSELELELESDGGVSGLPSSRDRERCPPRMRGLLLLPLLLGLLCLSSLSGERFLLCRDSDLRRFEFDLEQDLTGLGFLSLNPLLDWERLVRGLLDQLRQTLSLPLGLGVSLDWSLFPSGAKLSSVAVMSSLPVTVRQVASKASVSGGR